MSDWFILGACLLLSAYGAWSIRRDIKRGRASARGFGFDRASQPGRYRALMAFNCVVVAWLVIGALSQAALMVWRAF